MNLYILLNILSLLFSCLGLFISTMLIIFICIGIRPVRANIPLVLICNTYLTEIISSIVVIDTCSRTIFGILNPTISFEGFYCQVRAYFLYVSVDNIMYSFVVQAVFQLFRVVFYQRRAFQTFRVLTITIIIQWIFVCLINLIYFPLNDFVYISSEYRCLIPFANFRGSLMVLVIAYIIPTNLLFTIYFFILRRVRQRRQYGRKRDLIVLKRIMILFIVLQSLSTPLAVIWFIYIVTGQLISSTYQIQNLTTAFSQFFIPIFIAMASSQMRNKFRRQRRKIHPILEIQVRPNQIPERIRI